MLLKHKDPANALEAMLWDAAFQGLIYSIGAALLLWLLRALGSMQSPAVVLAQPHPS